MFSKEEEEIFKQGYETIGGIDEAGRGPLAGPVVSAVVVVDKNFNQEDFFSKGLRDSKSLSQKQREEIFEKIKNSGIKYRVCVTPPEIIDEINIWQATLLSWQRALNKLEKMPAFLFVDGKFKLYRSQIPQKAVLQGDSKLVSVALASIAAKVIRDKLMLQMDSKYPEYGFSSHKGYGTKMHMENLKRFGPCLIHRKSFKPVFENLSFKDKVYYVVGKIPKGEVLTYKQVAQKAGHPNSFRAVGNVLNKNRNPRVPCHRVISSEGDLGGYNKGTEAKRQKLKREGFLK